VTACGTGQSPPTDDGFLVADADAVGRLVADWRRSTAATRSVDVETRGPLPTLSGERRDGLYLLLFGIIMMVDRVMYVSFKVRSVRK